MTVPLCIFFPFEFCDEQIDTHSKKALFVFNVYPLHGLVQIDTCRLIQYILFFLLINILGGVNKFLKGFYISLDKFLFRHNKKVLSLSQKKLPQCLLET